MNDSLLKFETNELTNHAVLPESRVGEIIFQKVKDRSTCHYDAILGDKYAALNLLTKYVCIKSFGIPIGINYKNNNTRVLICKL